MTMKDLAKLDTLVQEIIEGSPGAQRRLRNALVPPRDEGGLGLHKRRALHLGDEIILVAKEVRRLKTLRVQRGKEQDPLFLKARELRRFVVHDTGIRIQRMEALHAIDAAVMGCLKHALDLEDVSKILHSKIDEGGAGLRARQTRNFTKKLSSLLLVLGDEAKKVQQDIPQRQEDETLPKPVATAVLPVVATSRKGLLARLRSAVASLFHRAA